MTLMSESERERETHRRLTKVQKEIETKPEELQGFGMKGRITIQLLCFNIF